jgi:signal transduction histidine kinase
MFCLAGTGWFIFLMGISIQVCAFQEEDADLVWYESFFQEGKRNNVESELGTANRKLHQAMDQQDKLAEAMALKEMGLIYLTRAFNYDSAMKVLIRALAIEDMLQRKDKQVFTYLAMAQVFEQVGDYAKGSELLKVALELNESKQNKTIDALILNELGKINASTGQIDDAFENYQQVLANKDDINSPKVEAEALFNLAHLYTNQKKYTEALRDHKLALSIRRRINDKKNEAQSLNDIGELYSLMKNDEKAMANHIVSLEIRQLQKDKKGIAESYNNIGVLYYQQRNFNRAVANLQLAQEAGRESDDHHAMSRSYEYLSECYEATGNFERALAYKNDFFGMNELIQGERDEQQLVEIQNRFVVRKSESEIAKLETDRAQRDRELEEQKKFRNYLFLLVGLCLIIAVLIFYFYLVQHRLNKRLTATQEKLNRQNIELQELNATKDKFFSIISHDLKGPLNSLTSFSSLLINHTESLSKEEIKMFAKDFDKSLKNLFSLLENLLEWSRSQTGNIEFTPELFDLAWLLLESMDLLKAQAQQKRITLVNANEHSVFVRAHKNSISTVIRNLISNAVKFTPEDGRITLDLHQNGKEVVVSVMDTGVGMSEDIINKLFRIDSKHSTKGTANEKGTGLGLILCKEFVEKNGGHIWVKSTEGAGSVFNFSLPSQQP